MESGKIRRKVRINRIIESFMDEISLESCNAKMPYVGAEVGAI